MQRAYEQIFAQATNDVNGARLLAEARRLYGFFCKMQPPNSYASQPLAWSRSLRSFRAFELRDAYQVVAVLNRDSLWNYNYLVTAPSGQYSLTRSFWGGETRVVSAANGAEVGRVQHAFWGSGATLYWGDGSQYAWRRVDIWSGQWAWHDMYGRPALIIQRQGWFPPTYPVAFAQGAALSVDPMLLAALGMAFIQIRQRQAAAAASIH